MKGFAGFSATELRSTPIPNTFFSDLLPIIDDLMELKVTLYMLWLLERREGTFRGVRLADLLSDQLLMEGLESGGPDSRSALEHGLELAVARGTLLRVSLEHHGETESIYFVNSEDGRSAVRRLEGGDWSDLRERQDQESIHLRVERPNLFVVYEQNIGPLTPLIAEELREAEQMYPTDWIAEAMRIAVEQNVRRWRYVRAILERWRSEGKTDATSGRGDQEDRYRYIKGDYADYVEH